MALIVVGILFLAVGVLFFGIKSNLEESDFLDILTLICMSFWLGFLVKSL